MLVISNLFLDNHDRRGVGKKKIKNFLHFTEDNFYDFFDLIESGMLDIPRAKRTEMTALQAELTGNIN